MLFTRLTNPDTPEMKTPNNMDTFSFPRALNMDTFSFPRALLEPLDKLIMETSLPLVSVIEGLHKIPFSQRLCGSVLQLTTAEISYKIWDKLVSYTHGQNMIWTH